MDKRYCIFDMDGTLTDSMGLWQNLGREYLLSKGAEPDETLLQIVKTMTMAEAAAYFMQLYRIPGPPAEIVREMEAMMDAHYRNDVPLKPGALAYLRARKAEGAQLYVATATAAPLAHACFARLGIADLFDGIVSCETLGVSKAQPDVFLLAAERMGAAPADCAVFEDALFAAKTAKSAGFYTVGIREASYSDDWDALQALCDEVIADWQDKLPGPSQRLREAAHALWAGYLRHPFVTGIGDGTLDPAKFRFFLLQDYLYLLDYAKIFALGVVKAEDAALMQQFAASLHEILDGEMAIHRAYMAQLGITPAEVAGAQRALANTSYTSYMRSVAFTGSTAEIVAAILACSWSYAEIGAALAARPHAVEHPLYGTWIAGYTAADYEKSNAALIALMDTLAADCSPEAFRRLEEIFVTCSRYEAGFWDMAWNGAL